MIRTLLFLSAMFSAGMLLAACGDDDGGAPPGVTATVPAGASATAGGNAAGASAAALCSSQKSLEGQALVPGVAFALDIFQRWQLCNGGAAAGNGEKWMFHTEDGGKNWTLISRTTLGNPPKQPGVGDLPNGNGVVQFVFIDSKKGFMGLNSPGANLWQSTDGGMNWTALDVVPPGEAVQSISFTGQDGTVVTSSGKWVTTDGGAHWVKG
jgi:hypothetical protein